MALTKTDGGNDYTASDYLFVSDPEKPSTWKLRVSEYVDGEKKVTVAQLGRAAAAFSSGGFRGNKVDLPSDAVSKIKSKLRSLYKKLGVSADEIPDSVKASLSGKIPNITEDTIGEAFSEFTIEEAKPNVINNVCVFGSRVSKNNRTYSDKAISSITKLSEGAKVFIDHATNKEDQETGGVRKLRAFLGALYGIEQRNNKIYAKEFKIHPDHMSWVKGLVEYFPDKAGFSINASGKIVKANEENVVEDISKIHSVDLVSSPATTSSFFEHFDDNDVDNDGDINNIMDEKKVTLELLESEYPHLVEAIIAKTEQSKKIVQIESENKQLKDVVVTKDAEIKKINETIAEKDKDIESKKTVIETKDSELNALKIKVEGYETKERMAEKKTLIERVISESKLPTEAVTPTFREILNSLQPKKETQDGKEVEISVEEQAKKYIEDYKGVLAKPPKVIDCDPPQDKDDKGKAMTPEQFAEAIKKSRK